MDYNSTSAGLGQSNLEDLRGTAPYDFLVKIKMVGDSNVGKSSIVLRFVQDSFNESMVPTIGIDYKSKIFDVYGKKVKSIIWDTGKCSSNFCTELME